MPRYKTLRVREEDYARLKDIQRYLRRKGTEVVPWNDLGEQEIVDFDEEEDEDSDDLATGFLVGVGAAALAYLVYKGLQNRQQERQR